MLGQLILSGISQGSIYALVALGMTVLFRATTIVNFAQGDMFMFGAFVVYVLLHVVEVPYVLAALGAIVLMLLFGLLTERVLIRPISHAPHMNLAMMTVALSYLLRGVSRFFWGREVLSLPPVFSYPPVEFAGLVLTPQDLLITGITLALVLLFFLVLHFSRLGKITQAASQSPRGAALVGINVPAFHGAMWAVASVIAAVAAILIAPVTLLYPDMGAGVLIRAFAAMTLGGFGSLGGAVIGGLGMGVIEQLAGAYVSTSLIDIAAYLVIIVVLLWRPAGLFGRREVVRV
ncbi:MAG: branched-chain amino acid ABC transporter permease [Acetobacteraceae bacterium]